MVGEIVKEQIRVLLVVWMRVLANYIFLMQTRQQGSSFLTELKQKLLLSPTEAARAGTRYNVPLINSLVLYIGMQVHPCFKHFGNLIDS